MSANQLKKLKEEIAKLKKQADEYLNGWKRSKADYINREKDIAKEKEDWVKFANQTLILEILPIYDNLQKAMSHPPAGGPDASWFAGMVNIQKQFSAVLKKAGIEEIKTVGEKFNPELHEAVAGQTEDQHKKQGMIIKQVAPGYKMHGKVIRAAKVIVS